MKTFSALCLAVAAALALSAAEAALAGGGGDYQRERAFRDIMLDYQASALAPPSGGDSGGGVSFALIPEWDYVHNKAVSGVSEGSEIKMGEGTSKSWALTFIAGRQFTDWLKVSFLYKYSYTAYNGGMVVGDVDSLVGTSDITLASHLMGFIGNFTSKTAGNFEVSIMEAWDIYSGDETLTVVDTNTGEVIDQDTRSADSFDDRVFSFIVWWDKDFDIADGWKIDPYLGWRTVQVVLNDMNDFQQGDPTVHRNDSSTVHLASGGLKFKYGSGPLELSFSAGVNHRVTKDPVPGFASRANAPNNINLGVMSCWDRTVGAWGLGFSYVLPQNVVIGVSYFGAAGSNTIMHSATGALVFLF
jgi:hypothetical protein